MKEKQEVMMGNYAMARGLVEAGIEVAAAYPGTPSSEILPALVEFKRREKLEIYTEWSTNERCAFEVAFGAASAGAKSVCVMKQVGLNVAFPALLRAEERPIRGALVIISCDDPGPQSSQTEQDTRLLAALFNLTVLDPSSPGEAADVAFYALQQAWETKKPVIIRSTHRVSHAREMVSLYRPGKRKADFPEGNTGPDAVDTQTLRPLALVASGMCWSVATDVLRELHLTEVIPLFKVVRVSPPPEGLPGFVRSAERVLVLEETDWTLEALLDGGGRVLGRRSGHVPGAGELTYDVVRHILGRVTREVGLDGGEFVPDGSVDEALRSVAFPARPPRLCAGCPHRASFYAMRYAFPDGVFPGDIGCYTLGIAQGAVDTCLDMGGSIGLACGFSDSFSQDGIPVPVLASIGDSTFFHSGLPPLYEAAKKGKPMVLVIMDNGTTAMTGMQPTPQTGFTADGLYTRGIPIEEVVRGFGVPFLRILDPYDVPQMIEAVREAQAFVEKNGRGPAVILARRECVLHARGRGESPRATIGLEKDCIGCRGCISLFDCPAFSFREEEGKMDVDQTLCTGCGTCLFSCVMTRQGRGLFRFQDSYLVRNRL